MKIKKIFILSFILVLLFIIIMVGIAKCISSKNSFQHTTDLTNYNEKDFPLPSIFLNDIPNYAKVVSFSYYNYYNEEKDIYLELKFNNTDQLEEYLKNLLLNSVENFNSQGWKTPQNNEWFLESQNMHKQSYVDMFCVIYSSNKKEKNFTGYSIEINNDNSAIYECNFGVISYSYEELTIIQNYCTGTFQEKVNKFIPKYFDYFNVPLNKNYERLFYLD